METPVPARLDRPLSEALPVRQLLLISGLFWTYAALSNVLYAHSFGTSLTQLQVDDLFASWQPRLLQHLLLLGPLIGCFWLSLRLGWRPSWWKLPVQSTIAVGFSALPHWALMISLSISYAISGAEYHDKAGPFTYDDTTTAFWVASGTSSLVQYGFGLALVTGFALYRRYRNAELQVEALERQSNAARLSALRMQLSPHTLFNLLNTIRGQIGWDPRSAQQLVVQLSELLRKLLSAGEREFSLLSDELRFARLYLDLQQSRFSDRLRITLPADDTVPALWVPSLILQPLVENAVVHGLAGHDGPVTVSVDLAVGEHLVIVVANDMGPPVPARDEAIGLRNVRERLAVHFGSQAILESGAMAGKWRAEMRMPRVSSA
jgi:signal transduction histidine kinase